MPLEIIRHDITKMKVDTIVNAANTELKMGGGVCGAIFQAAGAKELQGACDKIGGCAIGQAVITDGFNLPAKYVIHTPGPIWQGGKKGEPAFLKSSYVESMKLAEKYQCESIAFPLISTGIYGYPKEEAIQIAISTISSFLLSSDLQVYLVVFDTNAFRISEKLFTSIHQYIDEHYVDEFALQDRRNELFSYDVLEKTAESLVEVLDGAEESFSERLLRMIDERGMTDVETYKKANIDRRLFSKIRKEKEYTPKKKTALAFAVALKLDVEETNELLSAAGYTLSRSHKFDLIIEYFMKDGNYNIHEINEALFSFEQPLLGM